MRNYSTISRQLTTKSRFSPTSNRLPHVTGVENETSTGSFSTSYGNSKKTASHSGSAGYHSNASNSQSTGRSSSETGTPPPSSTIYINMAWVGSASSSPNATVFGNGTIIATSSTPVSSSTPSQPRALTTLDKSSSIMASASTTAKPSFSGVQVTSITDLALSNHVLPNLGDCSVISSYFGQTPEDWANNDLDVWLDQWVGKHVADIANNTYGFTGAFAAWAIGNPDFSCRDDGSSSHCDFDPCDIARLQNVHHETREAYYVMESLSRFHTYFVGMREGFTVSAIGSALSKDDWATTFYKDKDYKQVAALREALNFANMAVGIGASFASLAGPEGEYQKCLRC